MNDLQERQQAKPVTRRQIRWIIYVNENQFTTEWEEYNPVMVSNKTQALIQNGHAFTIESKQ